MRFGSWYADVWKSTGPITVSELAAFFELSHSEIQTAMIALEAEGFVLRGLFRSGRALAHLPIETRIVRSLNAKVRNQKLNGVTVDCSRGYIGSH